MIPPNTPATNKVATKLTIFSGIKNRTNALQTERQGTQLNGLKFK